LAPNFNTIWKRYGGGAENAGHENEGPNAGMKMQDRNM